VAEDQALTPGRRPAVLTGHDLAVGSAHAEREPIHQQVVRAGIGLVDIDYGGRPGVKRHHGECTHCGAEPTDCGACSEQRADSRPDVGDPG
jgi:hypothetical protein